MSDLFLTVRRSVLSVGVDPLVGQDLDVFPAGATVQLVGSGQPAAHPVRYPALLGNMVLKIRRGLHGVLWGNRKHMLWPNIHLTCLEIIISTGERTKACQSQRKGPCQQFIMELAIFFK